MKNKLAFLIDEIFKLVIIFFISLVFFKATSLPFWLCIVLSSLLTLFLCVVLYFLKTKRYSKKQLKINEIKEIEKLKEQFSYASNTEIQHYLKKLFNAELNYKKELTINSKSTIINYNFDTPLLNTENIKTIYKQNKNRKINKVIIICNDYNDECKNFIKNFQKIEYEIMDVGDLYLNYIIPQNYFPNFEVEKIPNEKFSFTKFKKYAFNKRKAKTYFFCGIILLFSSYLVPLKMYYLTFSAIMFISSLLCFVLNTKKAK